MAKHVLVIDDQESMRSIISRMLTEHGFKVTVADDGAEALYLFREKPEAFDLILSDVNMPNLNGFELLEVVKTSHSKTPVIFLTGLNETVVELMGEEYHADGIIHKPFKEEEVLAAINKVLPS